MIFCLCGMVTLKPATGSVAGQQEEIAQLRRRNQERQVHRIQPTRLKRAIVNGRRNGVAHRIGDHAVDLGCVLVNFSTRYRWRNWRALTCPAAVPCAAMGAA